jgi:hypothetical protein
VTASPKTSTHGEPRWDPISSSGPVSTVCISTVEREIALLTDTGLAAMRRPENIQTKFVHLAVRERKERPASRLKLFEYENITVHDRATLTSFLGHGSPAEAAELDAKFHELDRQEKAKGKAGVAFLFTSVAPPEGANYGPILRYTPVILQIHDLDDPEDPDWKDQIKDMINNGYNLKREMAKREKGGGFM